MRKRNLYLTFLAFAQLMLIGHSIIPHHHHESIEEFLHSGYSSTSHEHINVQKLNLEHLDLFFSFIPHGEQGLECISCPTLDQPVQKQFFSFESNLADKLIIQICFSGKDKSATTYQSPFYSKISELLPDSLRAPPSRV